MNRYRLELGTKVYERSEGVTECQRTAAGGCRQRLRATAPGTSRMRALRAEVRLGPAVLWGVAEQVGAGSPSAEFRSVCGVFLQVKMRTWFF